MKCWWCIIDIAKDIYNAPRNCRSTGFDAYGYFCSPSCALAYVLVDSSIVKKTESVTLIQHAYGRESPVIPSPPKEVLCDFGGPLTYEEYNKKKNRSTAAAISPPLTTLQFEWNSGVRDDNRLTVSSSNANILSKEKVSTAKSNLKLKRSKPLQNKYISIEKTMGVVKASL